MQEESMLQPEDNLHKRNSSNSMKRSKSVTTIKLLKPKVSQHAQKQPVARIATTITDNNFDMESTKSMPLLSSELKNKHSAKRAGGQIGKGDRQQMSNVSQSMQVHSMREILQDDPEVREVKPEKQNY